MHNTNYEPHDLLVKRNSQLRGIPLYLSPRYFRENLPDFLDEILPKIIKSVEIEPFGKMSREWVYEKISPIIDSVKGCFFKTSVRSSKDSNSEFGLPIVSDCEHIYKHLVESMRITEDLIWLKNANQPINLNFIEFLDDCRENREFRCFICRNEVAAITAYHKNNSLTKEMLYSVFYLLDLEVLPKNKLWLTDFVIDGYINDAGEIKFLEVNTFLFADPCLLKSYDHIIYPSDPTCYEEIGKPNIRL